MARRWWMRGPWRPTPRSATTRMMETVMKLAFAAFAFVLAAAASACNTVEGVGQDIESAGEAIEEAADENK